MWISGIIKKLVEGFDGITVLYDNGDYCYSCIHMLSLLKIYILYVFTLGQDSLPDTLQFLFRPKRLLLSFAQTPGCASDSVLGDSMARSSRQNSVCRQSNCPVRAFRSLFKFDRI